MIDFELVDIVPEDFHRKELIQFLERDTKNSVINTYLNKNLGFFRILFYINADVSYKTFSLSK
ncbi:hypothetical protein [Staphylococcus simulans]|uniref:hypothetical protein n=1 Tax=Staphylococcus simulans TaxID=1286 RepID=UPI000D1EB307|nr:hypothetical protein [Staphylococcus simulans]PTJ89977.1 hypothetical protein BU032_11625 [Staphylococcus simulans]